MKLKEILESAGTVSGGIATVAMPLSMQTRAGDSLLTGKYTADPTPNTPKKYKRKPNASRQFENSIGH